MKKLDTILTLGRYIPEWILKLRKTTKIGMGHQSVQLGAGKLLLILLLLLML